MRVIVLTCRGCGEKSTEGDMIWLPKEPDREETEQEPICPGCGRIDDFRTRRESESQV